MALNLGLGIEKWVRAPCARRTVAAGMAYAVPPAQFPFQSYAEAEKVADAKVEAKTLQAEARLARPATCPPAGAPR